MPESYNGSDSTPSPLQVLGQQYYKQEITINRYAEDNQYGASNIDSISHNAVFGKGENANGQVGSAQDIQVRNTLEGINRYSSNNPYGAGNIDALSHNSDFGKGENASGQVGNTTDIQTRNTLEAINKYDANKRYPDF
jgi:hypothetical protein